jgi:hypothetical protein
MSSNSRTLFTFSLILAALFIMAILAGCNVREDLPTIEETLPTGFDERMAPRDFLREMTVEAGDDTAWIRCFDCNLDWQGLCDHLDKALSKCSYEDTTTKWLPVMTDQSGIPAEHTRHIFKIYSSSSGFGHILAINIEYMRSIGGDLDTTGDYIVFAGYDWIEQYK